MSLLRADRKSAASQFGCPDEEAVTLVQPDPTWALEYAHFKRLCESGGTNLDNDLWINKHLHKLIAASLAIAPS